MLSSAIIGLKETRSKTTRKFLLTSNAETEMHPVFDGASYIAVPPRIAIGPLGFAEPLERQALLKSNMNHWLRAEVRLPDSVRPDVLST